MYEGSVTCFFFVAQLCWCMRAASPVFFCSTALLVYEGSVFLEVLQLVVQVWCYNNIDHSFTRFTYAA